MTWKPHINYIKNNTINKVNILKAINGTDWGADRNTHIMLYKNMICSKLEYGCCLYSTAAKSTFNPIQVIQNNCLRIATGALRNVKIETLEVESGVYPIKYHFDKICLRTAATIISTKDHPLRHIINEYKINLQSEIKPFSTRTHFITIKYKVPINKIEPITPFKLDSRKINKNNIFLNENIHKADCPIKLLQEAREIINSFPDLEPFYTDGSKKGDNRSKAFKQLFGI